MKTLKENLPKWIVPAAMLQCFSLLALAQGVGTATNTTVSPAPRMAIDTAFVGKNMRDNKMEIELSELALKRSTNQDVTKAAQQMLTDHTQILNDLARIAQSNNMLAIAGYPTNGVASGTGANGNSPAGVDTTALSRGTNSSSANSNGNRNNSANNNGSSNQGNTSGMGTNNTTGSRNTGSYNNMGTTGTTTSRPPNAQATNSGTNQNATSNSTSGNTSSNNTNSGNRGNTTNSGNTGNTTNSGATGNTTNSGNSGNTSNSGTMGNTTNSSNTGNTTNNGNSGNTSNSGTTGNTTNSSNTGNTMNSGNTGNIMNNGNSANNNMAMQGHNTADNMKMQAGIKELQTAAGPAFDKLWVPQMLSMHEAKLAELSSAAATINDSDLKTAVNTAITKIKSHRDLLLSMNNSNTAK